MRVICVATQKSGTGKTTSVVNIALALAKDGNKVLMVDLDLQFHLTYHFGINSYDRIEIDMER